MATSRSAARSTTSATTCPCSPSASTRRATRPRRARRFLAPAAADARPDAVPARHAGAQLQPVWRALRHPAAGPGSSTRPRSLLVDRRGRQRVGFPVDQLTSEGLAHDVRRARARAGAQSLAGRRPRAAARRASRARTSSRARARRRAPAPGRAPRGTSGRRGRAGRRSCRRRQQPEAEAGEGDHHDEHPVLRARRVARLARRRRARGRGRGRGPATWPATSAATWTYQIAVRADQGVVDRPTTPCRRGPSRRRAGRRSGTPIAWPWKSSSEK